MGVNYLRILRCHDGAIINPTRFSSISIKRFVFDITDLAPFIAAIVCIIAFKDKRTQLAGLKFSVDIRVIERILLALILPLVIFIWHV